ncbi:LOW QUALITY PROTEIN: hypothetical protein CFOL_v3_12505, partial [Cephalotus follicularis]
KNESLRGYLTRFNKESLMVKDLEPSFALAALNKVDYEGVRLSHNDPMVVTLQVELFTMKRILIDNWSSANILYKHAFDQLRIPAYLRPVKTLLVGFAGEMVHPMGSIDLSVVAGTAPCQTQVMTFLVVDTPSPYKAIIGRSGLNLMEAIVSTMHLSVKFSTRFGVGEVQGDQQVTRQCYKTVIMDKGKEKVIPIANVELRGEVEPERSQLVEEVVHVPLEEGDAEKVFQVGSQLGEVEK